MKAHTRIMISLLLVGLLVMTGCEKRYTGDEDTDTKDTEAESVSEIETERETNPETVTESVDTELVTESGKQTLKEFESSIGYQVTYDESLFEYNRTREYDELTLKGQTFSSKPLVFFAAMKIDNDEVAHVIEEIFTESAQSTTIGQEAYTALCQPTAESYNDGRGLLHHNQYLVQLINGDALLFETQWYEENGDNADGAVLEDMLASILISSPVQEMNQPETADVKQSEAPVNETAVTDETEASE